MKATQIALEEITADPTTVVVAGHFQVVWCPRRKKLIPVIASEPLDQPDIPLPKLYRTLLDARGSFPETTLEMGAQLCRTFGAYLLVLVDDVWFKRFTPELPDDELETARVAMVQRGLPVCYWEHIEGFSLLPDVLAPAYRADVYTENRLNLQLSRQMSVCTGVDCTHEERTCSDTAIQLLSTISSLGFRKAVLYIPVECSRKVEAAIIYMVPNILEEVVGVWVHLDETHELVFEAHRFRC